jgi:uncharacterized membrane protein/protein-disulfide isomerase
MAPQFDIELRCAVQAGNGSAHRAVASAMTSRHPLVSPGAATSERGPSAPAPAPRPGWSTTALGFAIIGLAASIASLVDYAGASAAFCAESGCNTVRESAWAHPLGIPMPVLGIAFYAAALGLGFVDAPRLRRTLAIAGAAWAVLLIALQALVIGAWCKLCMVADPAALGYALAVLAGATALRFRAGRGLAVAAAVSAAVGALALWTHTEPPVLPASADRMDPALPGFVAKAQLAGTPTVVEVVDFECPFCRRMQDRLTQAIAQSGGPVHVVRRMMPLAMHPHATPAALAYCCADAQGKGEAMAKALFAAAPDDLTTEGCEQIAASVGCDLERYRRDLPAAAARVAQESAQARDAGVEALPTLFIGEARIIGASKSAAQLTQLIAAARS